MEGTVIVPATIGGKEVCFPRVALIMVYAARPPTKVRFSPEFEGSIGLSHVQGYGIAEPQHLLIHGMKPRDKVPIFILRDYAAQSTVVSVYKACPSAVPSPEYAGFGNWLFGSFGPRLVETPAPRA